MLRLFVACAACALAGAALVEAQAPAPAQTTFRTGVDVVHLDVSVLDKNHQPVTGLTAADFLILEEGKPQSVVAFSAVEVPRPIEQRTKWMRDVAPDVVTNALDTRRLVVIVMDDAGTAFDPGVTKIGKQVAASAVDELGPADLAAVVFTFMGRDQNFTSDRGRLLKAIASFSPQPAQLACIMRRGGSCAIDKLLQIGDVLRRAPPGRKSVIYVGSGPGLTVSTEPDAQTTFAQDMFREFQQANINVNAFDANGLQTFAASAADRSNGMALVRTAAARLAVDDLQTLAGNTGGRTFSNTNTPWEHVPDVFRENSSYYLIGFQSSDPRTDGRYRRLRVKVNRPDVEVRTRSGYFAPKNETPHSATRPAASALDAALANGLPSGDVALGVTVAAFASAHGGSGTELVVTSHLRELNAGAAKPDAATADPQPGQVVTLAATAFDQDGNAGGTHRQTVKLVSPPLTTNPQFEAISRLPVKAGRYEVGVAAENAGHTGGVFAGVDVPNFAKDPLSLSGLVIGRTPDGGLPPSASVADLLPLLPTTARVFAPGDRVSAFLRIYQGGTAKASNVQLTTRVIDDQDKTVTDDAMTVQAEQFTPQRAADHRVDLPVARLRPGQYLLRIEAALGNRRVQREVRFTVRGKDVTSFGLGS
jgi:VWFA-related protein